MKKLSPLFASLALAACAHKDVPTEVAPQKPAETKIEKAIEIPARKPWANFKEVRYGKESRCPTEGDVKPVSAIEGDFDGDGKLDGAKIVRALKKKQEILYVWLSSRDTKQPLVVETIKGAAFNNMEISLARAGDRVPTPCSLGYSNSCGPNDPEEVVLKTDGVWFGPCGGTASFFVWDEKTAHFGRFRFGH